MNRRNALLTMVAGGAIAASGHNWLHASNLSWKRPLRIGGPVSFSTADPFAWAQKAKELQYGAVYAPEMSLNDKEYIRSFVTAVKENSLIIAEVGRWVNILDTDPVKREKNIKYVTEGLALADELGARCCVDIAGSFSTESWYGPHPKNVSDEFFEATVVNVRKIIDAVKPARTKFALEMMGWIIPDTPDCYLKLMKAIDRKSFGVHVDVCNLINSPEKFWNTDRLIDEVFDKLGPWILSAHAKDLRWIPAPNIHFEECVIGDGAIDYAKYLKRLVMLDQDVPLMIEHMKNDDEYKRCKQKIFEIGKAENIDFG